MQPTWATAVPKGDKDPKKRKDWVCSQLPETKARVVIPQISCTSNERNHNSNENNPGKSSESFGVYP